MVLDPLEVKKTNIDGAANVIEAATWSGAVFGRGGRDAVLEHGVAPVGLRRPDAVRFLRASR